MTVSDFIVNIVLPLIMLIIGYVLGSYFEKKKKRRDFHSKYFEDLWAVIYNVDGVIQTGRIIRDKKIMKDMGVRYSTFDIVDYLKNRFRSNDKKLMTLLNKFALNMERYNGGPYVRDNGGDFDDLLNRIDPTPECKESSAKLTNKIQKRLDKLIVK